APARPVADCPGSGGRRSARRRGLRRRDAAVPPPGPIIAPGTEWRTWPAKPLYAWRWSAFRRPALVSKARVTKPAAGEVSEKIQPGEVIPRGQEHQPQNQDQPKPKSDVL